ncbi:MAG TPA: hypothetical protein VFH21_04875 [Burkholderiales bacterium]|nr:hypothetical protein [Burkholderiales bacterium]
MVEYGEMAKPRVKLTVKIRGKPRNRVAQNPLMKKGGAHPLKTKKASRPVQKKRLRERLDEEL